MKHGDAKSLTRSGTRSSAGLYLIVAVIPPRACVNVESVFDGLQFGWIFHVTLQFATERKGIISRGTLPAA